MQDSRSRAYFCMLPASWFLASLVLFAFSTIPSAVLAQDNIQTNRTRRELTELDLQYRESVLRGWRIFQTSHAADKMACANCHRDHSEMTSWAGAYPKVEVFDGGPHSVKTLRQVVIETLRRHTDLTANEILDAADPLVAYITWWGDGRPVRPGLSEKTLPPDNDLLQLRRCQQKGKKIVLSAGGRGCGRCHTALGGSTPTPEILNAILAFPRFDPAAEEVISLDTFLARHAAQNGFWLGDHEITHISAFLAEQARGRLLKPGFEPSAKKGVNP